MAIKDLETLLKDFFVFVFNFQIQEQKLLWELRHWVGALWAVSQSKLHGNQESTGVKWRLCLVCRVRPKQMEVKRCVKFALCQSLLCMQKSKYFLNHYRLYIQWKTLGRQRLFKISKHTLCFCSFPLVLTVVLSIANKVSFAVWALVHFWKRIFFLNSGTWCLKRC